MSGEGLVLSALGLLSTVNLFILGAVFRRIERMEDYILQKGWDALGRPERRRGEVQ